MKRIGSLTFLLAFLLLCGNFSLRGETAKQIHSGAIKENRQAKEIQSPQPGEFMALVKPKRPPQLFKLVSSLVTQVPTIDGSGNSRVWQKAPLVTVLDYASQRPITVKSVHTNDEIFLLVQYPDAAPSLTHKSLGWDYSDEIYKQLKDREDLCVIKWSMVGNKINLSLQKPEPHQADIWFWKAVRTNPVGYADDKYQLLTKTKTELSNSIPSPNHGMLYLQRISDRGKAPFKERLVFEYQGEVISQYRYQTPTESHADVKAKGRWKNGLWTIEFARKLNTGYQDDIAFVLGQTYLFGISLYEITNAGIYPELSQPLYKAGDVYDHILLTIK